MSRQWLDTDMLRPTDILNDVLTGKIKMRDAPKAIQSQARLPIYDAACSVLAAKDKEARRKMLARLPEPIRPYVEQEAKRVWAMRQTEKGGSAMK